VPVTRHFSAKNGTGVPQDPEEVWFPSSPRKVQLVGFCDWLSMYQRHPEGGLPVIADGAVVHIDADGVTDYMTLKRWQVEGSYKTGVMVRCDGETVWFDGNVSKYGRPDNVFGYSFSECLLRVNAVLVGLDLPPFTAGESFVTNYKGSPRTVWTGAMVTRIDVTQNFSVGSKEDAYHFMRWLAGQQASRLKTGTHGEGETVHFGQGSRRVYAKAYLKGPELRRHGKRASLDFACETDGGVEYLEQLADWCDRVGLVRFEATLKSTKLHDMGCHYLGGFDMALVEREFLQYQSVLTRASAEIDELADLPKSLLSTYRMWQAGDDIVSKMSRRTFYRHRRDLLPYGVDIAVKSNVAQMVPRTRVVRLGPVAIPDFYQLPEIERKRHAANDR
jgi:hypothetical protein